MPSITFAAPILPGKTEAWKATIEEINGSRREEYIQARRSLGITKEVVSLQQMPQSDMVVVYIETTEATDPSNVMQAMIADNSPFHTWFKQAVLQDCPGIDASGVPPANQVSLDII